MSMEVLTENARRVAEATRDAVSWLDHDSIKTRVGSEWRQINRELRMRTIEASKLAEASKRLMSIAIFGPSQVGKSHLVSVLAAPKGGELTALFKGERDVSYIKEINPDKGKEATGLVTRFSVQQLDTPAGFPVKLRLLSHADVIKILCNAYVKDANPARYDIDQMPTSDEIAAHIAGFTPSDAVIPSGLTEEDIWDIQDYFTNELSSYSLYQMLGPFWDQAAALANRLRQDDLARFLAILWGRHERISDLYRTLIDALKTLNFATEIYCPLNTITDDVRIIDVDALSDMLSATVAKVDIVTDVGTRSTLSRSILAALAAELTIVVKEKAWDFQRHTDILDFPGYRTRGFPGLADERNGKTGIAGMLDEAPERTLKELFLRGKVDYLFKRYVAEQEITAMLLCVKESNMEVVELPDVIANWIEKTHGRTSEERKGKKELLFFILTRFDLMLMPKANDSVADPVSNFDGRMRASLVDKFCQGHTWPNEWMPGQPFRNLYLMRSPGAKSGLFTYDGDAETAIHPGQIERMTTLKDAFCRSELVAKHFRDPARAFVEMLKIGDGGTSYIVENLSKVCLPETKPEQIRFRLAAVSKRLNEILSRFYVANDIEKRLTERTVVAQKIADVVENTFGKNRFASLLSALMVDGPELSAHLQRAIIERDADAQHGDHEPPRRAQLLPRPGVAAPPLLSDTSTRKTSISRDTELAKAAISYWMEKMHETTRNLPFMQHIGMDENVVLEIISELAAASNRLRLTEAVEKELSQISIVQQVDEHIAKAAVIARRMINRFVSELGLFLLPRSERPFSSDGQTQVFPDRPVSYDIQSMREPPPERDKQSAIDWIWAFHDMVITNAKSESGLTVDLERNSKLGHIMDVLEECGRSEVR